MKNRAVTTVFNSFKPGVLFMVDRQTVVPYATKTVHAHTHNGISYAFSCYIVCHSDANQRNTFMNGLNKAVKALN